ncbi:spore germination lipoprotein GerD [Amphibacillus cookii]|uniref:spore germination lipoprotein GerD n=1 Tax=Amphibacillus cookii TaxID=767787 RepID=UPI0019585334|nr:spore germination lipoprotein GerD [Amphibacillus cookii]MBM7542745.1 spore germination protein D [Amphibacillus cookii]
MSYQKITLFVLIVVSSLMGCSPNNNSSNQEANYETTKKMVTDILKSDEGKESIVEVIADESTQQIYVIHDQIVQSAIEEALTSEEGQEFWSNMFSDQEFVKEFSDAMISQQEDVFKRLMSDASFQEKMLELLANPEIDEQMLGLMKSQQFKSHLEESIQETLESPLFQAKVSEIVVDHAKKIMEAKDEQASEDQESEDDPSSNNS